MGCVLGRPVWRPVVIKVRVAIVTEQRHYISPLPGSPTFTCNHSRPIYTFNGSERPPPLQYYQTYIFDIKTPFDPIIFFDPDDKVIFGPMTRSKIRYTIGHRRPIVGYCRSISNLKSNNMVGNFELLESNVTL